MIVPEMEFLVSEPRLTYSSTNSLATQVRVVRVEESTHTSSSQPQMHAGDTIIVIYTHIHTHTRLWANAPLLRHVDGKSEMERERETAHARAHERGHTSACVCMCVQERRREGACERQAKRGGERERDCGAASSNTAESCSKYIPHMSHV